MSVRWKVACAFALLSAIVLGALGAFVYVRVAGHLTEALDRGLLARSAELAAAARRGPGQPTLGGNGALENDENPAQVLGSDGAVLAGTGAVKRSLLLPAQLERALDEPTTVDRPGDAVLDEAVRLTTEPIGGRRVAVVGASLDERDEALRSLLVAEAVGIALALALISGGGYLVSGLVMRPEREALARERRFVADASHELRTPLTVLRSEAEVALIEEPTVAGLQAALRSVGEEAERLTQLTEDLLVLAQTADSRLPIRLEPIDAGSLLAAIAARGWPRTVRAEEAAGVLLHADRLRLEQALTNLVDNAIRHGAGEVELTARREADAVVLAVRDHGPGLPEGFAARAFERFSRADSGRTGSGTGLGLAIVRAVVEAHGGTVGLADARPGTLATIRLPHRPLIKDPAPSSA